MNMLVLEMAEAQSANPILEMHFHSFGLVTPIKSNGQSMSCGQVQNQGAGKYSPPLYRSGKNYTITTYPTQGFQEWEVVG